jgi:pimeloyl-ACP methyl ester carboxylesterase
MTAVVLVHGAWHGSWCWTDFAQHLADRGHRVRAVQLRGHNQAPGRIWYRIGDYVEDVRQGRPQHDARRRLATRRRPDRRLDPRDARGTAPIARAAALLAGLL